MDTKNSEHSNEDCGRALESSFFADRQQSQLGRLQEQLATQQRKQALSSASGIRDDDLLDHLLAANIQGETITALGLVPLIAMAWSDGTLDQAERAAILAACEVEGIGMGSLGYQLMESWLETRPPDSLLNAWKDFIGMARTQLSPEALSAFKGDILARARRIVESPDAASGTPGISAAERKTMAELESSF